MSISMDSYHGRKFRTFALQSERKVSSPGPMSGGSGSPLVGSRADNLVHPSENVTVVNIIDQTVDAYSTSFRRTDQNDRSGDDYGGRYDHMMKAGQMGICDDPYCTTCPIYYKFEGRLGKKNSKSQLYGNAKGWARRSFSSLWSYIPGVMNPHSKIIHNWNKFFFMASLIAIFIDPLFFFLMSVQGDANCIVMDWPLSVRLSIIRSIFDFIYFINMLLQFRLAYVAPESRIVGAGDLVAHPKKIALHYLSGYFLIDLFNVLPLPQIMILLVLPKYLGSAGTNFGKNLLRTAILGQYLPRLYRFMPLIVGLSPSGFIFESPWTNFIINPLVYLLAGHVVASFWYLFLLQRINECFMDVCRTSGIATCYEFLDCGHGYHGQDPNREIWINNNNASNCLVVSSDPNDFAHYGVHTSGIDVTMEGVIVRYFYSLFWGFQQVTCFAGNQVPSYFIWEIIFTWLIILLGLCLFPLLVGNMTTFLQSVAQRKVELSLRRRDIEHWMRHRRLPENLRRRVRESERFNWVATRGVNEEMLIDFLPDNLQRDIRRHLCMFVKNIRIFSFLDEPVLDSIFERLRPKTYIKGSKILERDGLVEKMVFIVRGKMESVGEDECTVPLCEGDVCGEELLAWCLEHTALYKDPKKIRSLGHRLVSSRTVTCTSNVEAFTLQALDIEEVTNLFARILRSPRVQGAMRYESPYWRGVAARRIQVAWKYRKKRLSRVTSTDSTYNLQDNEGNYLR